MITIFVVLMVSTVCIVFTELYITINWSQCTCKQYRRVSGKLAAGLTKLIIQCSPSR